MGDERREYEPTVCEQSTSEAVPQLERVVPAWVPEDAEGTYASREVMAVPAPAQTTRAPLAPPKRPTPAQLSEALVSGDRTALARAITLVESNAPAHRPLAREILSTILPRSNKARRIGISGVPGAGKSTFIEAFGNLLCDKGYRVAVLAVDPSSQISGGSVLGDKTRMETLSRRQECFIRPSPSSGTLGGVGRKTRETILLCEAAGYDIILVETVGVGQSETEVRSMVDCFLLLMLGGAGDELQGIKKGIVEIAEIIAVNKTDGDNVHRARATRAELERVVAFLHHVTEGWTPPVLSISAVTGLGLEDLWRDIEKFFTHTQTAGIFAERRREQAIVWWRALVENELKARFFAKPNVARLAEKIQRDIFEGRIAPSMAAEEFLAAVE